MRERSVLAMLVLSLLLGLSPLAADPVIERGIDVFITPGDGKTHYDFASKPIPAGFFCKGSKPFTGRVAFKGLPLTTEVPGQLRGADTVIERLDDAAFDAKGVAVTRLQFRALSLVSIAPVKTICGAYHVYVSLGGRQRVTTMNILRTKDGGGDFVAPLAVNLRMTFIPVKPARHKAARKLELAARFTFPAKPIPWSLKDGAMANGIGPVVVDTDGDLMPDAQLPATSNFAPGQSPERFSQNKCSCSPYTCHGLDTEDEHCYFPPPEDPNCQWTICGN